MTRKVLLMLCIMGATWRVAEPAVAEDTERTICFEEGQWDAEAWTPMRLPSHPEVQTFIQRPESIGTSSFTEEEKKQHLDNVILMTDTGLDEGEFEVVFKIGPEKGTAPGMLLSPTYTGDALETGIAVFVADYTMAIWLFSTNPETRETEYEHLVRISRWQDPDELHVMRVRWSKRRQMVAFQVDDSDVLVLRFPDHEINSHIGVWGCHGTCDYYDLTIREDGTLPWQGTAPE